MGIEDLWKAIEVYSINLDNGSKELKLVEKTIKNETSKTYKITVGKEVIESTPGHLFYIVNKGWTSACDLEVGDELFSEKQDNLVISGIEEIIYEEPVTVYNLTVEGLHNYLVTKYDILVHNACDPTTDF